MGSAVIKGITGGSSPGMSRPPTPEPPRVANPATEKDRQAVGSGNATAERRRATGSQRRQTALTGGGGLLTPANTARKTALGS